MPATAKELIIEIISRNKPASLNSIRDALKEKNVEVSGEELVSLVRELQVEGIVLVRQSVVPGSFHSFLLDSRAWWIYAILGVALGQMLSVLYIPAGSLLGSVRTLLGLAMLGLIPGYSSQRALFPGQDLTMLERVLLSVFVSVVISVTIGVSLGAVFLFTPVLNAASLTTYAVVATLGAGYRSFVVERKRSVGLAA